METAWKIRHDKKDFTVVYTMNNSKAITDIVPDQFPLDVHKQRLIDSGVPEWRFEDPEEDEDDDDYDEEGV